MRLSTLSLDEIAGYPADEPERITESDMFDAERETGLPDDELSFAEEVEECCGGMEPDCRAHYRHYGQPRGYYTHADY